MQTSTIKLSWRPKHILSNIGIHRLFLTWCFLKRANPCRDFQWGDSITSSFSWSPQQSGSLWQGVKIQECKLIGCEFYLYHHWGRDQLTLGKLKNHIPIWHSQNYNVNIFSFSGSQERDQTHMLESRLINSCVDYFQHP